METKTEKVFNRKKELIRRDPAYKDAYKTFKRTINTGNGHVFADMECVAEGFNRGYWTEKRMKEHKAKYPDHWKLVGQLARIEYKWQVLLRPDFSSKELSIMVPYTNSEVIWVGTPPLITGYEGVMLSDENKYPRLNWSPYPNPFKKSPILFEINEMVTPGYNKSGEKWIPILINVSRLNKGDAKTTKKQIWSVIEANLQEGRTKKPYDEFEECAFLYHLRNEKTFKNYLRWYDIHVKERLGFRLIAFLERICGENIVAYEKWLEKLRTKKWKVQHAEKGEDRVEKGVKLIWAVIHREPYTPKKVEPVMEGWNCPKHGKVHSSECKDCKALNDRFNRIYSMNRGYMPTIDADIIDTISLRHAGKLPLKPSRDTKEE